MLQACWQDVFGRPILHPQTCLAVPGWFCFTDLIVPVMMLVLGAALLLYWHIPARLKICIRVFFFHFGGLRPPIKPASEGFPADIYWGILCAAGIRGAAEVGSAS